MVTYGTFYGQIWAQALLKPCLVGFLCYNSTVAMAFRQLSQLFLEYICAQVLFHPSYIDRGNTLPPHKRQTLLHEVLCRM